MMGQGGGEASSADKLRDINIKLKLEGNTVSRI